MHVNSKYADINEAVGKSDGLLVIGFFLDFDARKTPKTTQAIQFKTLFQPAKILQVSEQFVELAKVDFKGQGC